MKKIGLIAGAGELPLLVARAAKKRNEQIVAISLVKQEWQNLVDREYCLEVGQVNEIMKTLLAEGIREVVMVGKVDKQVILAPGRLDQTAMALLAGLKDRDDQAIMAAIVGELEKKGIRVLAQTEYLSDVLAPTGVLTTKAPDENQKLDIEYGLAMARQIASLNIGQTVVVRNRMVLAVEAIEGTDQAILRGGSLAETGAIVAKTAKPGHDMRFDIPTVGISTITRMAEVKAAVLAVEANRVLLVDKTEMVKEADKQGIIIVAA